MSERVFAWGILTLVSGLAWVGVVLQTNDLAARLFVTAWFIFSELAMFRAVSRIEDDS